MAYFRNAEAKVIKLCKYVIITVVFAVFWYVSAIYIKIKFFWAMIPSCYSAYAKILQIYVKIMFGIRILATFPAYVCCNKWVIKHSISCILASRNLNMPEKHYHHHQQHHRDHH
jgi:hypothetical protein